MWTTNIKLRQRLKIQKYSLIIKVHFEKKIDIESAKGENGNKKNKNFCIINYFEYENENEENVS